MHVIGLLIFWRVAKRQTLPSHLKQTPLKGGAVFSNKIFQTEPYPKFLLPSHGLEEPEEMMLFSLIQLSHQCYQLPQMEVYWLRLLLIQSRQDTQQHRVP